MSSYSATIRIEVAAATAQQARDILVPLLDRLFDEGEVLELACSKVRYVPVKGKAA